MVLAAGDSQSPSASDALESLCQTYWYPLYAYSRRKGISPQLSEDLARIFHKQFANFEKALFL
jgi:RNA polymerase sigma-70 factor (ECF subfamily)